MLHTYHVLWELPTSDEYLEAQRKKMSMNLETKTLWFNLGTASQKIFRAYHYLGVDDTLFVVSLNKDEMGRGNTLSNAQNSQMEQGDLDIAY